MDVSHLIYDTIFQSNESLHFKILKARLLQSIRRIQLDYTRLCNKIKICVFFSVTFRIWN